MEKTLTRQDVATMLGINQSNPEVSVKNGPAMPWWQKYTLTLEEAAEYFGFSYKKIRLFCKEHADADFIVWNGNRALIKRKMFEEYLDQSISVI